MTDVGVDASERGLQQLLDLAQQHLEMDLAFVAEFLAGRQVYRGLAGDATSFGWRLNDGPELQDGYCLYMTQGSIPHAIPDTSLEAGVRDLRVTSEAGIGSYVGVPVHLPDGSHFGSLCAVSHRPQPVDEKDTRFLRLLADQVGAVVSEVRARADAHHRMHELVSSGSIEIALQPIVDLADGHLRGVEALSRFPAGLGTPDVVFAQAHAAGLGMELEQLAVDRAIDLMELLPAKAYMALNLSPAVAVQLVSALRTTDVSMDRVVLEITEHSAVENYELLRESLSPAREQGLRLAIDDTGAGYASLSHIVELAPDKIKIDRALIDGLSEDRSRRSVVRALVTLADDLGAQVVGEGIETRADLETARDLGVGAGQGYFFARPTTDRQPLQEWIANGFQV